MPAPRKSAPFRKPQPSPQKSRFDLRSFGGALGFILILRLIFGLWALPISYKFPETRLEKRVAIWPPSAPAGDWAERVFVAPWMRYDAFHYAGISRRGYDLKQGQSAFHPLLPLLARPFLKLGLSAGAALVLISTLASLALCIVFARYTAKFHGETLSFGAPALLLGGLCGFLLIAPYTESLFLALALGAVWAMRDNRLWLAGALGAFAALTRQQGLALVLPLAWQIGATRRWRDAPSLLLILVGYGAFVMYRLRVLHDFDPAQAKSTAEFVRGILVSPAAQKVVPGQHLAWPWQTVAAQWKLLAATHAYHLAIDLFFGGALVILALCGWKHLHPTERLFALAIVLLSLCYFNGAFQPLLSLPRHMMIAFPIYLTLARWAVKTPTRQRLTLEIAFVLNLFLAAAYFRYGWVP